MKNSKQLSLFLVMMASLWACGKQSSQEQTTKGFKIQIDTLWVDSGDDFLYLNASLRNSDMDASGRYLYNYSSTDHGIEVIDLEELKLDRKIPLQKEGPDAVGYLRDLQLTSNEEFLIRDQKSKLFDTTGHKIKDLNLDKITNFESSMWGLYVKKMQDISNDKNRYVSLYGHLTEQEYFLIDYDVPNASYQKIDLPEFDALINFFTQVMSSNQMAATMGCGTQLTYGNDQLVISNTCYHDAYFFDLKTDSLTYKKWESRLFDNTNRYQPPRQVPFGSDEYYEIAKLREQELYFTHWAWDAKHKRYYRFVSQKRMSNDKDEWGRYKVIDARVYLIVLDADLNIISEMEVPQINQQPSNYFVKDGALWVVQNVNDELAFVRLQLEEQVL